jgi:Uma2 family endonuclease
MSAPPDPDRRQALYDEHCAVPPPLRSEIIDGTLYVMARPAPRHANATSVLGGDLNGAFQRGRGGPGGWWILFEPELQLVSLEAVSPDLAGWRVERMPALPATAYFELAPDWVCEVLSKSTESIDRYKKMPLYAAHGVRHVRIYEGDAPVRAEPFTAIEIDLAALWGSPKVP